MSRTLSSRAALIRVLEQMLPKKDFELHYSPSESGTNIKILIKGHEERGTLLSRVAKALSQYGAVRDRSERAANISSFGGVRIDKWFIYAKNADKKGGKKYGIENELMLVNQVKQRVDEGKINVRFHSPRTAFIVQNVSDSFHVGNDWNESKKADVILYGHKPTPISIKEPYHIWGTTEVLFRDKALVYLEQLVNDRKIRVAGYNPGKDMRLTLAKEIAVEASKEEAEAVMFGTDIKRLRGAVVRQIFDPVDFHMKGNTLEVAVQDIITRYDPKDPIYFLVRNDPNRSWPAQGKRPRVSGLIIQAVPRERITGNTLVIRSRDRIG